MSATRRNKKGHERQSSDFYRTPSWCVRRLFDVEPRLTESVDGSWLEPGAGDGAIVRAANDYFAYFTHSGNVLLPRWHAVELRAENEAALRLCVSRPNGVVIGDFFTWKPDHSFHVVIGNPPYSLAQLFVERAMAMSPVVVFLLRLNFLAGANRSTFMRRHVPSIYVLPDRPSFVHGRTDSTEYAWFVWGLDEHARVYVLATTSLVERRAG